jgi:nucleotide-binding universal stress UspA family protein
MKLFQKILVPVDFSPHAFAALRLAAELAKIHESVLCLLHVDDLIVYTLPEGMPLYDAVTLASLRQKLNNSLGRAKEEALALGVRQIETKLAEGTPYREIVRVAEEWGAQLIVMGTHGRSGFAHLLLGSVAERVVRKAPCAVMSVPLKQAQEETA